MTNQTPPAPLKPAERGPTEQLYPVIRYFAFEHLPAHLQAVSKPFAELAAKMVYECEPGPEVSAGLRKLLEAKDCFVRAKLP